MAVNYQCLEQRSTKVKVSSYIAQYLHFTTCQTCSFQHQLNFSGKYSAMLQLLCDDYSLTYIHRLLSTPVCSQLLIYTVTAERTEATGVNNNVQALKNQQDDFNPGPVH